MPIFEYKCLNCGEKFEKLVPSSNIEINCTKCNSADVEKLFSLFGFRSSGASSTTSSCSTCTASTCKSCR